MSKLTKLPFRSDRHLDVKYMGDEPVLTAESTETDFMKALNWYNYFFGPEAAKHFVITYMTEQNYDKTKIQVARKIDDYRFPVTCGWVCRILSINGVVPELSKQRCFEKLEKVLKGYENLVQSELEAAPVKEKAPEKDMSLVIVKRFDDEIDGLFGKEPKKITVDPLKFLKEKNFAKNAVQGILAYYKRELVSATKNKEEFAETQFKAYSTFLKNVIKACEEIIEAKAKVRRPRVAKPKPPEKILAKVQIKPSDDEFKIKSVDLKNLLNATQIWTFNTKYKILTKYDAPNGVTVKGTTIYGFDEKSSISKRLRKPNEVIPVVLNSGKVGLRSIMSGLKTTEITPTGRLNSDTILLRTLN